MMNSKRDKKKILGKKGMGIEQVFIFIVVAITFALIMIFGYKAVNEFISKGERVEFVSFKTELESAVKSIYTEYGSVRIKEFSLPGGYEKICFIDLDKPYPKNDADGNDICNSQVDEVACDTWKTAELQGGGLDKADRNVFLEPPAATKIKVYKIETEGGPVPGAVCLAVNKGRFKLRLEGKGDKTLISKVAGVMPQSS